MYESTTFTVNIMSPGSWKEKKKHRSELYIPPFLSKGILQNTHKEVKSTKEQHVLLSVENWSEFTVTEMTRISHVSYQRFPTQKKIYESTNIGLLEVFAEKLVKLLQSRDSWDHTELRHGMPGHTE